MFNDLIEKKEEPKKLKARWTFNVKEDWDIESNRLDKLVKNQQIGMDSANDVIDCSSATSSTGKTDSMTGTTHPNIVIKNPSRMWTPGDFESDIQEEQIAEALSKIAGSLYDPDTPREALLKEIEMLSIQLEESSDDAGLLAREIIDMEEKLGGNFEEIDKQIDELRVYVYQLESTLMDQDNEISILQSKLQELFGESRQVQQNGTVLGAAALLELLHSEIDKLANYIMKDWSHKINGSAADVAIEIMKEYKGNTCSPCYEDNKKSSGEDCDACNINKGK